MRLGIFGGTFDPIHLGHLRLAEEVGEGFDLDKVYLIPAASPPHKGGKAVTAFHHRFEMAKLAVEGSTLLAAFDLEARRQGVSYSIETLKEFHRLYPSPLELFFILGMDAFQEIETWKSYRELFDYAHFVVVQRPGIAAGKMEERLFSLGVPFRRQDENRFVGPSGYQVIPMEATLMDISSTGIREKAAAGKSIRYLVPESVRCYILQYGLYNKTNGIS
ncbi:MAG: nicotinate-nucleotide adenylyltransferase [Desulfatiglandales bacterium]